MNRVHAPSPHARHLKGLHSPPKVAKATTSRPTTGLPTTAFSLLDISSGCLQQLSDMSLTSAGNDAHEQGSTCGDQSSHTICHYVYTRTCVGGWWQIHYGDCFENTLMCCKLRKCFCICTCRGRG